MTEGAFRRGHGDIETAVVNLVDRLAPAVPVTDQPYLARKIAEVIASRPSSMGNNMFLRQSIIRGGTAIRGHVIDGFAAWVTVLFDLGNLRQDRSAKYKGIRVKTYDAEFTYPPGPARYARSGTLVLPGFASRRDAKGLSMNILDPLDYRAWMSVRDAAADLTQRLAVHVGGFAAEHPAAYWLWHPIPDA